MFSRNRLARAWLFSQALFLLFAAKAKPFTTKKLSETQIGQGLKEALSVGIDHAVASASKNGGYYKNDAIRIELPNQLAPMESVLRKVGAEQAAPQAKQILLDTANKALDGLFYSKTRVTDLLKTVFA